MSRLEFTNPTKREAFKRARGVCECHIVPQLERPQGCGAKLGDGNTFYEHINPDNIRRDNSLENCATLTKACWREKTTHDLSTIAKANRQRDRARGIRRRASRPMGKRKAPKGLGPAMRWLRQARGRGQS